MTEGAAEAPAEAAVAPSPVLSARLRAVRERAAADAVFADEVREFLGGAWELEGDEAVGRVGARWCRVAREEVRLGHDAWAGSKRIPL